GRTAQLASRGCPAPGALAFDAVAAAGKQLGRAASTLGVQRVANRDHGGQVFRREELGHEGHFLHADAVLSRHAAAEPDAFLENLVAGVEHSLDLLSVALVEEQDGMNIAIAGVKDVGNSNIVSSRDTLDE